MSAKILWQLRYRSPLSPTKGVDDVTISTNSHDAALAKRVAEDWLAQKMAHPSTRFVFVREVVVWSEEEMFEKQPKTLDEPTVERQQRQRIGA